MKIIRYLLFLTVLFFPVACDMQKYPEPENGHQREILIYSGTTMLKPLLEIRDLIEARENCRIKITYGGSGHLLKSVEVNRLGDIFFPGNDSYIKDLVEKGVVKESILVGYNQVGLFVQPGNPKQISSDLHNLLNKQFRVVIGSAEAGSIGGETEKILSRAGIYQEVVDNALFMTTDSKGLAMAIKNKDADLVLNWKAVNYMPRNIGEMKFITISSKHVEKRPLVMGLLTYSRHPELARKIMQLAVSETGQDIFRKYGFVE